MSGDWNDELMLPCKMYPSLDYHCHSSSAGVRPDIRSLSYTAMSCRDMSLAQLLIEKGESITLQLVSCTF